MEKNGDNIVIVSNIETVVEYHLNGKKRSEENYLNGVYHGKQTWWYENGQKQVEHHFLNGLYHGKQTWWYENGQTQIEHHFLNGDNITEQYLLKKKKLKAILK